MSDVQPAVALDIYRRVLNIRRFEEEVGRLFTAGELPGVVHLYIGEEAVAAGVCAALRDDDYVTSTHRGHGHVLAKGGDLNRTMAEIFGKETGYCRGKGGSQHIADFSIGMLGACGIVGGGMPIATGAGLSIKLRKTDQVSVAFFGDGAANEGSFHESLNLASAMTLPVIFVCENNQYGEFTPARDTMNIEDIAVRAGGYGMPGHIVDGTDALEVHAVVNQAVTRARNGEGPTLIEAKTHRRGGHAEGEEAFLAGQTYRLPEEEEMARLRDPLLILHERILHEGVADAHALENIEQETTRRVADAVTFARESPWPAEESVLEDTWA
ncbi:MAG: thiamine pyrophosphate-dependent dehydrogenase E1 component subunit alpha [Anaerolineae bacterium]|nr:thiamine pyrophosphate-dependent dehydrogenase E1 component subunit alpha [Anaerolineae bacterium]